MTFFEFNTFFDILDNIDSKNVNVNPKMFFENWKLFQIKVWLIIVARIKIY